LDPDPYWIRIGIQPKMLDPDSDEMNADPQPWTLKYFNSLMRIRDPESFLPLILDVKNSDPG
jgi:hypothetical protein